MKKLTEPRRRGIQSVEIGLRVLSALASSAEQSPLSAVAQAADLSTSQTHRYLSSLMAAGMAKQDPSTGHYDLDSGAIRLGLAALARLDIFKSADASFSAFAKTTRNTCLLAVWGDVGATIVRWYPGNPPVITSLAIGSVLPLMNSATGRAFFAFGDPAIMDFHAKTELAHAGAAPVDMAALRKKLQRTTAIWVRGDLIPGLRAVSSPIFDLQGRLVLVATAIANGNVDRAADTRTELSLTDACKGLTKALGGPWPGQAPSSRLETTPPGAQSDQLGTGRMRRRAGSP